MRRALAALSIGAFLTLVIDAVGSDGSWMAVALGGLFAGVAIVGLERVTSGRWAAYAYIGFLLVLVLALFGFSAGVGSTLLVVVVVAQSVLLLPVPAAAVVVAVVPFVHAPMGTSDALREGIGLLVAAVFAAVITKLLVREQQARAELAAAHGRLREYAAQAEKLAAAQERNRVARDIHDGLGHALTVVQMQIKAARAVLSGDTAKADAVLAKAQDQAEEALREVRVSVSALREPVAPVPLPEALKVLADGAGFPVVFEVTGTERSLSEAAHECLFRGAQEGLTNVRKHAQATKVGLTLDYSDPAVVRLQVSDDGVGVTRSKGGFGLVGIEERAAYAGGRMTMKSTPGEGSTLMIEVAS